MKKLVFIAIPALLLVAGCQKDGLSGVSAADQINVSFEAGMSVDGTKATIDNDGMGVNADRCRLQIYMKNGSNSSKVYDKIVDVADYKAKFQDIVLVRDQKYDFLFWADNKAGYYYDTGDLHSVTLNGDYVGNDDKRDAFFTSIADTLITKSFTRTVYLKRPFAQLNVITDDVPKLKAQLPAGASLADVVPNKVKLGFTAPDTFNVLTGEATGSKDFVWEKGVYTNPYNTDPAVNKGWNTLSMDYILASTSRTVHDISFTAKNDLGTSCMADISTTFTNVPLQRNWRTNIIGSLITNIAEFEVIIKPEWDGEIDFYDTPVMTVEELEAALQSGDSYIRLTGNVDVAGKSFNSSLDGYSGTFKHIIIDGCGYTIKGLGQPFITRMWTGASLSICNLTIEEAVISVDPDDAQGDQAVGAFVSYINACEELNIKDCKLINSSVCGGHWCGGFVGYAAGYSSAGDGPVFTKVTVQNCQAIGNIIKSKGSTGAVFGHATGDVWTLDFINGCTVRNNHIECTGTDTDKAGSLIGTVGCAGQEYNGKTGGVYVNTCTVPVETNTVKSGGVTNDKVYGRQGNATGKLYIDGAEVVF